MRLSNRVQALARISQILIIMVLVAACSLQARTARQALPAVFAPPASAPDFSVPIEPSVVEKRILATECGGMSEDLSMFGMISGLMTRPVATGGTYLDKGRTPDGTRWFLHRTKDNPDITWCGIALVSSDAGTNISVTNVRSKDMDAVKNAVESGDFLCECKRLSN